MTIVPSRYQEAIFAWVATGTGDAIVNAVAGAGKTTTLVEVGKRLHEPALFVAFNKHIADEIARRVKGTPLVAKTVHSVGLQLINARLAGTTTARAKAPEDRKYRPLAAQLVASRRAELLRLVIDPAGTMEPQEYAQRVQTHEGAGAVEFARGMGCIGMNEPARRLWERVYPQLSRDRPGLYGKLTGRAEAQTRRLACHCALMDRTNLVRPEHLRQALALWDYCERSVAYVFGDATGDKLADQLLAAIRAQPFPGPLTSDLWDVAGHQVKQGELHSKLDLLVRHALVTSHKEPAHGNGHKPGVRWRPTANGLTELRNMEFTEFIQGERKEVG